MCQSACSEFSSEFSWDSLAKRCKSKLGSRHCLYGRMVGWLNDGAKAVKVSHARCSVASVGIYG